ncbi:MAG: helix-turn-helix transcriptional regulator [Pseudomonadota bacterium]
MTQTRDLLDSLKKCLRAQGYTYRDVAAALEISEASVKRVFSEQTFSLKRLEEVCRFLDMSFYDLARMTRLGREDEVSRLTLKQEEGLAKDPLVLTYFYLLLTGRTPSKIATEFGLDDQQQATMLARLSKLKLVELLPNNNGRLLTGRRIEWHHDGPIRRLYQQQVTQAFLDSRFTGTDELFRFDTGELSASSVSVLMKKFERLSQEFDEFAELDIATPPDKKQAYGLLVGFRQWTFWQILEGTANDMGLNAERSQVKSK